MNVSVKPFERIGIVPLGIDRSRARELARGNFDAFECHIDAFDELGVHCHYDQSDHVEFIEAFDHGDFEIDGVKVLGRLLADVLADLRTRGFRFDDQLTNAIFPSDGIAFTLDENGLVEAVAVFREGYYDQITE